MRTGITESSLISYYTKGAHTWVPGSHSPSPIEPPPQIILGFLKKTYKLADERIRRETTPFPAFLRPGATAL